MLRSLVGSEMCIRDSLQTIIENNCFTTSKLHSALYLQISLKRYGVSRYLGTIISKRWEIKDMTFGFKEISREMLFQIDRHKTITKALQLDF